MERLFLDLALFIYFIAWVGFLFYFKTLEKKVFQIAKGVLIIGFLFYFKTLEKKVFQIAKGVLIIGFLAHSFSLLFRFSSFLGSSFFSFSDTLNLFSFLLVGVFIYFNYGPHKVYTLGTFFLPLPLFFLLLALFGIHREIPSPFLPYIKSLWFPVHFFSSLLSHSFLLNGFILATMYLLQEREIKHKHFGLFFKKLPPLSFLEHLLEKALYLGFFFLTLGILSGSIWSELVFGDYWRWSAKELISLALWFIYAAMLHQRVLIGWRGKRMAYMFFLGTGLWILTFFIINFYFKGFHTYRT